VPKCWHAAVCSSHLLQLCCSCVFSPLTTFVKHVCCADGMCLVSAQGDEQLMHMILSHALAAVQCLAPQCHLLLGAHLLQLLVTDPVPDSMLAAYWASKGPAQLCVTVTMHRDELCLCPCLVLCMYSGTGACHGLHGAAGSAAIAPCCNAAGHQGQWTGVNRKNSSAVLSYVAAVGSTLVVGGCPS
jgi:hypothetical protein